MDFKTSRKEIVPQPVPGTLVEVLMPDVFDLYPVYDGTDASLIVDVEIINDDRDELLDRSMFATVRQRGIDPIRPGEGIQWAEAVLEEVSVPAIMGQLNAAIQAQGPGVQIDFKTAAGQEGQTFFTFGLSLTNSQ